MRPSPTPPAAMASATASETEAFEEIPGDVATGLLLVCDHATNRIPAPYGDLGLHEREFCRHIAYDIGAAAVVRHMATALGAPAVLSRFSRLLIDPNRSEDDPTLIMRLSDGAVVPGNRHVDAAERDHRLETYYRPYHGAITRNIDAAIAAGHVPMLLSIHSFTERWKETPRPWHVTVLWDRDPRLPKPLLAALEREATLITGENVPYRGDLEGDCMHTHGTQRGLAHALIEIRQDLIRDTAGQLAWGERLARIMEGLLADAELRRDCGRIAHLPATA